MKPTNDRLKSSIAVAVFLVLFGASAAFFHSPIVGALLLLLFLLLGGFRLGNLWSTEGHAISHWWFGSALLISLLMVAGGMIFYLGSFSPLLSQGAVAAILAITLFIRQRTPNLLTRLRAWNEERKDEISQRALFLFTAGLLFALFTLHLLAHGATEASIRSIWAAVSPTVFVAFFVSALCLSALLLHGKQRLLGLSLSSLVLFVILSAAPLVFPLGFGFDQHLHQATEEHLSLHGTITPKPLYYAGQYGLIVLLSQSFSLPIDLINTWLLPLLVALLLPSACYAAARHLLEDRREAAFASIALFLLPLAPLIATTPQGLSNLWFIILICAAIPRLLGQKQPPGWALVLIAIAGCLVHPITGIPALLFVALVSLRSFSVPSPARIFVRFLFWLMAAAGCLSLPLAFAFQAAQSGWGRLDLSALTPSAVFSSLHLSLFFENRFNPVLDFVYLYGYNALALLIVLAGFGIWRFRRGSTRLLFPTIVLAVVLLINFILLSTVVDFSFLIDYERRNYSERLLPIFAYSLLPFILLTLGHLSARLRSSPIALRVFTVVLLAGLITAGWYLTYPRDDAYVRGRGFNVSRFDLDTVVTIETHADGRAYAVLANQAVSAAAVRELGFKRYWDDLFFYPIPTGGELYQKFLEMNGHPKREIAQEAAAILARHCATCPNPERIYYVVNAYWWEAPRMIETAKTQADGWFAIGDKAVHVFWWNLR